MRLLIEKDAWQKIAAYVDNCPYEISGLGRVEITPQEDFRVTDVAIFRQKVSAAHSDIDPAALAAFQADRVKAGESMKEWILWWHSHAHMGVFFSKTDTDTMDASEFPYMLSLVTNKKHETLARFDVYKPIHLICENIPVEILSDAINPYTDICKGEIAAKVETPPPVRYSLGFETGGYQRRRDKKTDKAFRKEYHKEKKRLMAELAKHEASGSTLEYLSAEYKLEDHIMAGVELGIDIDPTIGGRLPSSIREITGE